MAKESSAKRLARLAAVQALYQVALGTRSAAQVIADAREHPQQLFQEQGPPDEIEADQELFGAVVVGVTDNIETLDPMIDGAIDAKFAERLEPLLRAILRAGAYELHQHGTIKSGIIINDYVDVAHGFFNAKEPGLVNAVLDRLAKSLRANAG